MKNIILKFKNAYAKLPEITESDLASITHEETKKLLDWLISAVKLESTPEKAAEIFERVGYDLDEEFYDDVVVELYTYPTDNTKFTKRFEVEKSWLIDTIIEMDKKNARVGCNLQSFLDNYIWIESHVIYEKAKSEGKLLYEGDLVISKEAVQNGLEFGYIKLIECPNSDGTVCSIGDNWFYFDGFNADGITPEEYWNTVPLNDIVEKIYSTLETFRKDKDINQHEYAYYEVFLREIRDIEQFVCEQLNKSNAKYTRIPKSLCFEVYPAGYPFSMPFSVVKIDNYGFIIVDNKPVSQEEFVNWVNKIKSMDKEAFIQYIQEEFSVDGSTLRLISNVLDFVSNNTTDKSSQKEMLHELLDGTIGLSDEEINQIDMTDESIKR